MFVKSFIKHGLGCTIFLIEADLRQFHRVGQSATTQVRAGAISPRILLREAALPAALRI
jgi:hypothetical protein